MKIFICVLLMIHLSEGMALQCSDSDNVTLRDPGMSFSQGRGKVQNQLNSGICYASTLSLMLEPLTSKPLSFSQLSLFNPQEENRSSVDEGDHWIDGGNPCSQLKEVKKLQKKNPKIFRLCSREQSIDNYDEFRMYESSFFATVEDLYKNIKLGRVRPDVLKDFIKEVKGKLRSIKKSCDRTSDGFDSKIYQYGLIQNLTNRCALSDQLVKVNNKKIKKLKKEISDLKKPVPRVIGTRDEEDLRQLRIEREDAVEIVIAEKNEKINELKAQNINEIKIRDSICDPASTWRLSGYKRFFLNEKIKKNLTAFGERMNANPGKVEDGRLLSLR